MDNLVKELLKLLGDLPLFLPKGNRHPEIEAPLDRRTSLKDFLEALGIPHPEIFRLEVNGAKDGKDAVLNFPGTNEKPHNLNFKYFQEFEGVMTLPANFQPAGIKVNIATTSPSAQTLEQNYAWPKL